MKNLPEHQIDTIRSSSRTIVRELGFMRWDLAESKLSASAVHCILEIGNGTVSTAREVSALLKLEKSSVSRLLKTLEQKGLLLSEINQQDARSQTLALSPAGRRKFSEIETFARGSLQQTLSDLSAHNIELISKGLHTYANALLRSSEHPETATAVPVSIQSGYQPSLLGQVVGMHGNYYSNNYGFGRVFECKVASEMAEFIGRLDQPINTVFSAMVDHQILGSVSIDGEDLGGRCAHLRWFIVKDSAKGLGVGQSLLSSAIDFVDQQDFEETRLWTFKGLDTARHLYEKMGFVLVEEKLGEQWGRAVQEQCFVRQNPSVAITNA